MLKSSLTSEIVDIINKLVGLEIKATIEVNRHQNNQFIVTIKRLINPHSYVSFDIHITLDIKKLWSEYQKLPIIHTYKIDFTADDVVMKSIIEMPNALIKVIESLKDFNGVSDNYIEIANLVEVKRGFSTGKKFGI